jgi:hypothetical protein
MEGGALAALQMLSQGISTVAHRRAVLLAKLSAMDASSARMGKPASE